MGDVPVTITIKAAASQKIQAFRAMEKSYEIAKQIEKKVSEFQPTSQTSLINKNDNKKWSAIGEDLLMILSTSKKISKLTNGSFDVTFASKNPNASYLDLIVDEARKRVLLKRPNMKIGVSAPAKGYILDQMTAVLKKEGFTHFIVNGGGDLVAAGAWIIRIRDSHTFFHLKNQAAMSSGLLERGHHIINPRTHMPVNPDYLSVTVIAPSGIVGDPLAVGAFVAGLEETKKFLSRVTETEAFFLYGNKTLKLGNKKTIQR